MLLLLTEYFIVLLQSNRLLSLLQRSNMQLSPFMTEECDCFMLCPHAKLFLARILNYHPVHPTQCECMPEAHYALSN